MFVDLKKFWLADKELSIDPDWKRPEKKEFARLIAPIDIDGVTIEGLFFTISANIYMPDRLVTFQMEYQSREYPRGVPMVRFEWRPQSPHNNKGLGPEEYRFLNISGTHIHPFDLNWEQSETLVRKGILPIAIPIIEALNSFEEALAYIEGCFRIKGVIGLPPPPWTSRMV